MYACHVYAWYLQKPKEDAESPGTRVEDDCNPPCGCWELSSCCGIVASDN